MAAAARTATLAVTLACLVLVQQATRISAWEGPKWYNGLEGPEFDRIKDLSTEDYDMR